MFTEIEDMEKNLSQLSEKMLMVVAIKYGKDSREYEKMQVVFAVAIASAKSGRVA
jgi:hypothetical protein